MCCVFILIEETASVNRVLAPELKDELLGYIQKYNDRENLMKPKEGFYEPDPINNPNATLEDRGFEITACLARGWYQDVCNHVEFAKEVIVISLDEVSDFRKSMA